MRDAARKDVVKLINYGRTLPGCENQGKLCATLLAAAAELAYKYERDQEVTVSQFSEAVRTVYQVNQRESS